MTDSATALEIVQRKLGRCLLHLQECESLLKSLVIHADIAGPPDQLQDIKDARAKSLQKEMMGNLIGMLTKTVFTSTGVDAAPPSPPNDQQAFIRIKYQIELTAEQYDAVCCSFKELVNLRNELVHHFLERFDIRRPEGCAAANLHLDESGKVIDVHYMKLLNFVKASELARAKLASAMKTQEFKDAFIKGILPD
ncbi:hypothetical protein [Janthinobacterium sp. BJB446]|uniref:hypothetical protein n=1 Tax=Janthinobacterium sp. BJB446 TaxID=2048009 RepID=UPI00117B6E28|nr:hypothetical protein [Janthinobacterium sp. BJB446]